MLVGHIPPKIISPTAEDIARGRQYKNVRTRGRSQAATGSSQSSQVSDVLPQSLSEVVEESSSQLSQPDFNVSGGSVASTSQQGGDLFVGGTSGFRVNIISNDLVLPVHSTPVSKAVTSTSQKRSLYATPHVDAGAAPFQGINKRGRFSAIRQDGGAFCRYDNSYDVNTLHNFWR